MSKRTRWEAEKVDRLARLKMIKTALRGAALIVAIVGNALVGSALIQLGLRAWSLVTYSSILGTSLPNVPVVAFEGLSYIAVFGLLLFVIDYLIYLALVKKNGKNGKT